MYRVYLDKKGVVLYMVLATLLIVVILANVVLNIILSQSRITHHQVSRIRAYYANLAGMNLAFERLRTGNTTSFSLCSSGCTVNDADIPYPVDISISSPDAQGLRTITLTTTYTYTE